MNRKDIDNLLWNKLPEIINDKQKKNMINNLIAELRNADKIKNSGTRKEPVWILEKEKQQSAYIQQIAFNKIELNKNS